MGGGGKGGGGGEIPEEIKQTAQKLRDIGVEQFDMGIPLLQTGGENALSMLRTGNVAALEPAIRTAVEQTRSMQSQGLTQLNEQIARQGLTGTAAQEALARGRLGAENAVAQIPSQFTLPFLQQMAGPAFALPEQGMQGIAQAGQIGGVAAGPSAPGRSMGAALSGAGMGALQGAAMGSVVPGLGTAAGAVIGGGLGLMGSK